MFQFYDTGIFNENKALIDQRILFQFYDTGIFNENKALIDQRIWGVLFQFYDTGIFNESKALIDKGTSEFCSSFMILEYLMKIKH